MAESHIQIVKLAGSSYEVMGEEYGKAMKPKLIDTLSILKSYYIDDNGLTAEQLYKKTKELFDRFPCDLQDFIKGVAEGSDIPFSDAVILNGMETLASLATSSSHDKEIPERCKKQKLLVWYDAQEATNELGACSFFTIPEAKTISGNILVGRIYDFPPPFDIISKYLTITVLCQKGKIPVAFISMPGQIYCATCINSDKMFFEFNNGTPSGSKIVNKSGKSLLSELLLIAQTSHTLSDIKQSFDQNNKIFDYSLIVGVANATDSMLFEISSDGDRKPFLPSNNQSLISTNFFQNETWHKSARDVTDFSTWFGITRKNNLSGQLAKERNASLVDTMKIIDKKMDDNENGATWPFTIYQTAFDTSDGALCLKRTHHEDTWNCFSYDDIFEYNDQYIYVAEVTTFICGFIFIAAAYISS